MCQAKSRGADQVTACPGWNRIFIVNRSNSDYSSRQEKYVLKIRQLFDIQGYTNNVGGWGDTTEIQQVHFHWFRRSQDYVGCGVPSDAGSWLSIRHHPKRMPPFDSRKVRLSSETYFRANDSTKSLPDCGWWWRLQRRWLFSHRPCNGEACTEKWLA